MPPIRHALTGARWHLQHGPIDLVIGAEGDRAAVEAAHAEAWARFQHVLAELVAELPLLRRPAGDACALQGGIARRMWHACRPHRGIFITPMAAVAGAVADEVMAALVSGVGVERAYVNNGGDIALYVQPGAKLRVGVASDPGRAMRHGHGFALDGSFEVDARLPVRGVATSGWRGRSWSLGIADSVTVLAQSAAAADAAATLIANAVDCEHPAITRTAANLLHDDTDLGDLPVTVAVGPLPGRLVALALDRGAACAQAMREAGLIYAASLALQGQNRVVQPEMPWRSDLARSSALAGSSQHQGRTPCSIAETSWR
jgi:ApbE superfamily uncharacterized protein (UPF0280 family)